MIILHAPSNTNEYIPISDKVLNQLLQENNFFPLYWDNEIMYYKKNVELKEFLKKVGEDF